MDVIIPLGNGSNWENKELRYCLRSLEKNFLDLGAIYIVGDKPSWARNVKHINTPDLYFDNKGATIINKVISACIHEKVSDNFLFTSDDQCFLKPMHAKDVKPYYTYDLNKKKINYPNKFWKQCMKNTKWTLRKEKLPCFNYETHTPKVFNKELFVLAMQKYDWVNNLYPTHSLYFNNVVSVPGQIPDDYRIFFDKEGMDIRLIEGKTFLGYSDLGLSWRLQAKLKELFPKKSRFEQ